MSDTKRQATPMARLREAGARIVVTGAAGGIGSGIVERLLADGWRVLALDLTPASLEGLRARIGADDRLAVADLDVSSADAVERCAEDLAGRGVAVAGLVNAAGILQDAVPLLEMDLDHQRKVWDVNYFGAFHCTKWFGAMMAGNGGGAIVNITSINELRPLPLHAYAPSKVALGALTRLSAGELGAKSIRVNAVAPGFTRTPALQAKMDSGKRDARVLEKASAMGRLVEIEEIASVVGFLISDNASGVSGASIPVDAGWLTTSHWMNFGDLLAAGSANGEDTA
ncbi:MAG: SDR family oxidoreductase [Aquamicrobium sp.]|uniref:SDR family NAD(P)-dependent oxidoreductase n=1 Tax=Aquamicrobium sp. TaxID=1872579 RepID=UPI00349E5E6D|nr:SDR family oxidoreductase [Aquamicrobium sp.]